MAIIQSDRSTLGRLKREDVEKTLSTLNRFMKAASWIGVSNRYAIDTAAKIAAETDAGRNIQSPGQLSEYIAASSLLHCTDGWSYLGRAISALLRGDPHRAIHLAYYAELRAATALLATEGIGVFNKTHFAITAPSVASQLGTSKGTHIFAWDCLEFWANQIPSASLFAQVIRPYGISLENWFAPHGGSSTLAPQAQAWFRQWGMDLRMFPDDHLARNLSTYQPDGLPKIWKVDGNETINFVRSLWESLEPAPSSRFDTIDRHILRLSLENSFKGRFGKAASKARPKFRAFVTPIVEHQGLSAEISKQWISFMAREIAPDDLQIFKYSQKSPSDRANSIFAVVARATLLLRAASGSTLRLFQAANHLIDSYEFWWKTFGVARGLWDGNKDAGELQDLWIDIRDSLSDIEMFQEVYGKSDQTFFRLGQDLSKAVGTVGSCERVALWSMTP